MVTYKIGICDDEEIYILQMKDIIKKFSKENFFPVDIIEYKDGQHLLRDTVHLNLLFLNIEMSGFNGIELKNMVDRSFYTCKIIFVSNHEKHMVEAFGKNVIAFINKNNMKECFRM